MEYLEQLELYLKGLETHKESVEAEINFTFKEIDFLTDKAVHLSKQLESSRFQIDNTLKEIEQLKNK